MAGPTLDAAGLHIQTLDEIQDELRTDFKASAPLGGAKVATNPNTIFGQLIDIWSRREHLIQELAQAMYDARSRDTAEGNHLDANLAMIGVDRDLATYSTATATLGGTPATLISAGSRVRVPDGGIFATDEDATISGAGSVDVGVTATVTGPVEGPAGQISEIVDMVTGWATVTNALDAELGQDRETDPVYRDRGDESLQASGTGTDQALAARMAALDIVIAAVVLSNRTSAVDSRGIPPHSGRLVLWPTGLDAATIAAAIWNNGHPPTGIRLDGTESADVQDAEGVPQTMRWSYATEQLVYLEADVTTDSAYPATGDALVAAELLAWGNALLPGQNVDTDPMAKAVVTPGIRALAFRLKIGSAPGSGDTAPLDIDYDEIARFDSARITVTS